MTIVQILNHADLARARLVTQFRGSVSLGQMLDVLTAQVQELEGVIFSLLATLAIDGSAGEQLDRIGAVIGIGRAAMTDAQYRAVLHAQILVNRASGTTEELIAVLRAVLRAYEDNAVRTVERYPGAVYFNVVGSIGDAPVDMLVKLLGRARAAGIRTFLQWEVTSSNVIRLGVGPGLGTGRLAGVSGA